MLKCSFPNCEGCIHDVATLCVPEADFGNVDFGNAESVREHSIPTCERENGLEAICEWVEVPQYFWDMDDCEWIQCGTKKVRKTDLESQAQFQECVKRAMKTIDL